MRNIRSFAAEPVQRITKRYVRRSSVELPDRHIFAPARFSPEPTTKKVRKAMLCLLIAAHNEELVLAKTITSAIAAGMSPNDIYVVDDHSEDKTSEIARSLVPAQNVVKVHRSGKGLAISKAAKRFRLARRYSWIHIADADGAFAPDYFHVFRRELRVKHAAATGYVRSLPGKRISEYRVYEYTVAMEVHRRIQAMLHVVPVIPGPTSCFRSDVFAKVNFDNKSMTEDFDVTLQLHRMKLGTIQFIPEAVAYTQDPKNLKDYTKQITRWNRGGLQSMLRHGIGRRATRIDAYLSYTIIQNLLFFASYLIWVPYMALTRDASIVIASAFVVDVVITFILTFFAAATSRRWDIMGAFPQIYVLRWVSLGVFLKAFVEVVFMGRHRHVDGMWENRSTRRYVMEA